MLLPRILSGLLAFSMPVLAAQPFDGDWTLNADTTTGTCAARSLDVTVAEGQIGTTNPLVSGAGHVSPTGVVAISMTAGTETITASGRAKGTGASGKWSSSDCKGIWHALRR